ncbi:hypothetical protein [Lysobacter panacisoli]|uniref:Protein kinase domain-containing protein n=1 Tax=Lysobacter panacisoli TaxID=1255263 RepID=A0ABP9LNZ3_9GAMM|nr:hypothetical protein [Lysobacter panacisoli]
MSVAEGSVLRGGDGRSITLAKRLASGGAGTIHLLRGHPGEVAKIYHTHVDVPAYRRRIEAMLELAPHLPDIREGTRSIVQLAWPSTMLSDRAGRFVGFLMPAVDVAATTELELILQTRQAQREGLPTGLGAKVTLAANLAAVLAELHRQRHYVVDLKPVNLRFYRQSLYMAMLDCDGFSIQGRSERFNAPQYTPDYLAPEFHRNGLTAHGEPAQDRFALAVIVFQLLNFGIHPYAGRPSSERVPTDLASRIAGDWYPYGIAPRAGLAANPGSGHAAMPDELRRLFDRAFTPGAADRRPSASEWAELLSGYALRSSARLVACHNDGSHQHFAGQPCAACERAQLLRKAASVVRKPRRPPPVRARAARRVAPAMMRHVPRPPTGSGGIAWPVPSSTRPRTWSTSSWFSSFLGRMFRGFMLRLTGVVLVLLVLGIYHSVKSVIVGSQSHASHETSTPRPQASSSYRPRPARQPSPMTPPSPARPLPLATAEAAAMADVPAAITRLTRTAEDAAASCDGLRVAVSGLRYGGADRTSPWAKAQQSEATGVYLRAPTERHANEYARRELRQSLEIIADVDPRAVAAFSELGWMSLADGLPSDAQWQYARALTAYSADAEAWYGLGVTMQEDGPRLGAFTIAETLASRSGRNEHIRRRFLKPQTGYMEAHEYDRFLALGREAVDRVRYCASMRPLVSGGIPSAGTAGSLPR